MKKNKKALTYKIEDFILNRLKGESYSTISIVASNLLTWNRFDLAFKLFYLENKESNGKLAEEYYQHDIRSQTLGNFSEYGSDKKINFREYLASIEKTYDSLKIEGFNSDTSLLPLSENKSIINGAHRLACAIYLGLNVECLLTELPEMVCDYRYFFERNVPAPVLDSVANTFVEYSKNTYIAFLWPSGMSNYTKTRSLFSDVVYEKKIRLKPKGAFNLIVELYKGMDWVGNEKNGYKGAEKKLIECFPSFQPFSIIAFQSSSLDKVRDIKQKVRDINGLGFSSIHITDTHEEAARLSKLVFNENGIHFLNHSNPYKHLNIHTLLNHFGDFLAENKIDRKNALIDSALILSFYGIRESNDVDFLINDNSKITISNEQFDVHDDYLIYHAVDKQDLIYNSEYHFWYKDFKFVSFRQLYRMKQSRNEIKDKNDCKLMVAYIENRSFQKIIAHFQQYIYYNKIKFIKRFSSFRITAAKGLKNFGLHKPLRWIYRITLKPIIKFLQ